MLSRPVFRPHWHIAPVGDSEVFLIAEGRNVVLNGRAYVKLARLIDGERTTDAIVDELIESVPAAEIYLGLMKLERDGFIEDRDAQVLPPAGAAWWGMHGVSQVDALEALRSCKVGVRSIGRVDDAPVRRLLHESGAIVASSDAPDIGLHIVVVDDYLQPELRGLDAELRAAGTPWFPVKPVGIYPWFGPLFQPTGGPCWSCLAQRLMVNRDTEEYVREAIGATEPFASLAASAGSSTAAISMAVTEVTRFIVTGQTSLADTLITFNSATFDVDRHRVVKRPQCPVCGDPELTRIARPVEPQSRLKTYTRDGGHRAMTPEAALRTWSHHISPVTGVVRMLTRITDEDDLLHVYVSGTNMALRTENSRILRRNLRGSNCGKGVTDAQARMSAVGEAIERYSGVFRGEEPRERGTLRRLGDRAIDPDTWTLYSDAQYASRDEWNSRQRRLDAVPHRFTAGTETDWSPVWSLTRREHRLLPTSLLYYNAPPGIDSGCFVPESNGTAAGASLEDAMLQGLMELVERDSVAVWWYNRLRQPTVDLDSFGEPYVERLRAAYAARNRNIWMIDVTSDLGIPAFVAFSRRIDGHDTEDIVFAPAAHLDPRIAMLRALTELNQMIPGVAPPEGRSTGYTYDDPEAVEWWQTATVTNQPWILPSESLPPRRMEDFPTITHDDLLADILHVQTILEEKGLEVLALDQTRPDVGLPVVKMIVPGLRHFWARFAPGRLYDVPVAMRRLDTPTREEDLNPIPVFI
jgi:ribosomal protein S12 methylthiotransferase accessory factor